MSSRAKRPDRGKEIYFPPEEEAEFDIILKEGKARNLSEFVRDMIHAVVVNIDLEAASREIEMDEKRLAERKESIRILSGHTKEKQRAALHDLVRKYGQVSSAGSRSEEQDREWLETHADLLDKAGICDPEKALETIMEEQNRISREQARETFLKRFRSKGGEKSVRNMITLPGYAADWKASGFESVDELIDWCRAQGEE